jgi:hypothetical protein
MRSIFPATSTPWLIVAALSLGLSACGKDPEPQPAKKSEPIVKINPAPQQKPPPQEERIAIPAAPPPPEGWTSADAPNACDVLSDDEAAAVLGAPVGAIDITEQQVKLRKPVASACLFAFGKNRKSADISDLDAKFVRVQVFTTVSLDNQRGRTAENYFNARKSTFFGALELGPGFEAFWTTSDHPPDRSLLIRNGDVVLEVQSYPPSSGGNVVAPKPVIEAFVLSMYEKWL